MPRKSPTLWLITGLALVLGAGCERAPRTTAENTVVDARERGGDALTPLDQSNSPADIEITRQIRKSVVRDAQLSVEAKNVKIITRNGRVTLRGAVASEEEAAMVIAMAEQVAGPARVTSELDVPQRWGSGGRSRERHSNVEVRILHREVAAPGRVDRRRSGEGGLLE